MTGAIGQPGLAFLQKGEYVLTPELARKFGKQWLDDFNDEDEDDRTRDDESNDEGDA